MSTISEQALAQLNPLVDEAQERAKHSGGHWTMTGTEADVGTLHSRMHAAILRWSSTADAYRRDVERIEAERAAVRYKAMQLVGVLRALRDDYAAGHIRTVEELVHADVFADFLEMAEELLVKRYKDAAAVIVGSVLEEHLRKLAGIFGVSARVGKAHKKADAINADLVKAGAYNKLEQKNVTAWLGLRNDAAHGAYGNYDHAQVGIFLTSVREFITRHPA
jgi:hypothetical protein